MMPDWLETMTVVQIVGWLVAAGAILGGLRWLKPIADALHNLVLDWGGEPARDGVPARVGVMARLDALSREIAAVKAGMNDRLAEPVVIRRIYLKEE